jgi:nucleoside phosphorylase
MLEFSAIVSSVKAKHRKTQFCVLAALYFLGAHRSPVTVKQVRELLSLHKLKAAKDNLSDSLRKYSSFVEVVEKGPPLKWRLTEKGINQLRTDSGLSLPSEVSSDSFNTDVAFLCALQHPELTALMRATGGEGNWNVTGTPRHTHVYRAASLDTKSGKQLRLVATIATSMGLTAAAIATTQLVMQFRPRLVVMVGIAAGTRSGNKEFGDILVADPSVDYNSGKVEQKDGIRGFLPDPYPLGLNARLRSVLQKYQANSPVFQEIRAGWKARLPNRPNRLHLGPLGAADQVIDDATRVEEIQKNWRKLIGVEMETYGVYRACHEAPEPKPRFISFKSVCDFAAEKTDSWQDYAAFTAAEFAVKFLQSEWDALWHVPT